MSDQVLVALISTGGSVLTAIVALSLNTYWIGKRIDRVEATLDVVQADLKQFYRDIVQIKHKIGID